MLLPVEVVPSLPFCFHDLPPRCHPLLVLPPHLIQPEYPIHMVRLLSMCLLIVISIITVSAPLCIPFNLSTLCLWLFIWYLPLEVQPLQALGLLIHRFSRTESYQPLQGFIEKSSHHRVFFYLVCWGITILFIIQLSY